MTDFVMVGALVLAVAASLLQLALGLHVRNVLTDAAGEGARRAALVGGTRQEAEQRVRSLVDSALAEGYVQEVAMTRHQVDDLVVVEVRVTAPLPLLGLVGPGGVVGVTGHAVDEASLVGAEEQR
ncbi:TadE/TadG family type IV pilus assembly protein [Actinomyces lilanjuaniae]|nr:TadE/TadG family type IV pilus assembly protein [Actinomyces lilanjuaniae]